MSTFIRAMFVTKREASNRIGVSMPTLTKIIEAGEIGMVSVPGFNRKLVRLDDVTGYIERQTTRTTRASA